jgi:GMP synthase-like glutamine amidotransferase
MISFIDCYINDPVNNCVNQFVENTGIAATYHIASKFGTESLKSSKDPKCYVILGSAAHVTENNNWQKELLEFIIPKLESGIPVLGICYGHQLIAHYYGCEVGYIDEKETNYTELREVSLDHQIWDLKPQILHLSYAHSQLVRSLSDQFEELGHSKLFRNEIIKHKTLPFFGTQSHPEASLDFLKNKVQAGDLLEKSLSDGLKFIKSFYDHC